MRASRCIAASVLIASVLAWSGCGTSGGTGGRLEGIRWVLKSYDSKGVTREAPEGVSIDVLFKGGNVGGFSGVNTYHGSYKLSGSSLSIGELASTEMAGPPDLMDNEQAYLAALQRTSSYTADTSSLTLLDQDGKRILEYTKGKTPSLTGGTWEVISYYNGRDGIVSVINGTTLTALFSGDGALTGSTGVNDYRATYKMEGQKISVGPSAITTNRSSPDPAITQQQADYLAALQLAAKYNIQGERLDLLRADGGYAATFELAR